MAGAISGRFEVQNSTGHYTFYLDWNITSQGRDGNVPYSMVSFSFKGKKDSSSQRWWDLDATHSFTLESVVQSSGRCSFDSRSWSVNTEYTLWSSSAPIRINHSGDGSKTAAMSFTLSTTGTDVGTVTAGGNAVLLDIPMAGTLSLSSNNVTIANAQGASITATVGSYQSSFYYKLVWSIGNTIVQTTNFAAGTYNYTLAANTWGQSMPNSKTVTATATLYTYSDSARTAQIGSASPVTFTVNYTIAPTANVPTVVPSGNSANHNLPNYYRGQSTATVSISGFAGSNGSTLSGYTYYQGGIAQTTTTNTSWTSGALNNTGTVQFIVRCTDSRGNYVDKAVTITVEDYTSPRFTAYQAYRSDGTAADPNGTKFAYSATASATGTGNSITVMSIRTTPYASQSTASVEDTSSMSGILNGVFSLGTSYTVTFSATDKMGYTTTATVQVTSAKRVINVRQDKDGIAFGKIAETDNLVDSAWDIQSTGDITAGGKLIVQNTAVNGSQVSFNFSDYLNLQYGILFLTQSNYGGRFMLREYSGSASGRENYWEQYQLPYVDVARTTNASYDILTTKGAGTVSGATSSHTINAVNVFSVPIGGYCRIVEVNAVITLTSAVSNGSVLMTGLPIPLTGAGWWFETVFGSNINGTMYQLKYGVQSGASSMEMQSAQSIASGTQIRIHFVYFAKP